MSEDKKKEAGFFSGVANKSVVVQRESMSDGLGKIFGGGKATVDSNVHELGIADDNLGMKTRIRDVASMSVLEVVAQRAYNKGFLKTASLYDSLITSVKINLASEDGWRAGQMEHILTARREDELEQPRLEGSEKLLGKRSR